MSNCTTGLLFEYYYFFPWRLRSLAGNWVKMCPQNQNSAIVQFDRITSTPSKVQLQNGQFRFKLLKIWTKFGKGSLWQCKPGHLIAFPCMNDEWSPSKSEFFFYLAYLQVIGVPDQRLGEEICAWIKWDIPFLYIMTFEFALIPSVEGYGKKMMFSHSLK